MWVVSATVAGGRVALVFGAAFARLWGEGRRPAHDCCLIGDVARERAAVKRSAPRGRAGVARAESVSARLARVCPMLAPQVLFRDICQMGSLAGAAYLLNNNAGVLRQAQWEQKSHVEQKRKGLLDLRFSVGIETAKARPAILCEV